jgi:predicted nucleic acid-binding protein
VTRLVVDSSVVIKWSVPEVHSEDALRYLSMYLALAEALSTRVVTADRRLYNALQNGPFAMLVLWVEDGP